jgi:uncharacterized membrane protein
MATTTTAPASIPLKTITFENDDEDATDATDVNEGGIMLFISSMFFGSFYGLWLGLLILIWIISGFIAFIASVICLFYNSSIGDKMAGLVMALFAGPFYWLFYIYNMNYCNRYN